MDKKKAMLSQPMRGKTNEEIIETRNRAIKALEAAGYEVVNTPFTDEWYSKEKMEAWCCANSSVFSCEIYREHVPLPCGLFL